MTCPSCHKPLLLPSAPACGHCEFSLAKACSWYGDSAVELEPVLAYENFPVEHKAELEAAVANFQAQLPELFLSIYLGPILEGPGIREFAFWLMNQGQPMKQGVPSAEPNRNGILLIVDPMKRQAAVSLGYAVELWLGSGAAQAALSAGQPFFANEYWLEGLLALVQALQTAATEARQAWCGQTNEATAA
jgi:hypothetical protein